MIKHLGRTVDSNSISEINSSVAAFAATRDTFFDVPLPDKDFFLLVMGSESNSKLHRLATSRDPAVTAIIDALRQPEATQPIPFEASGVRFTAIDKRDSKSAVTQAANAFSQDRPSFDARRLRRVMLEARSTTGVQLVSETLHEAAEAAGLRMAPLDTPVTIEIGFATIRACKRDEFNDHLMRKVVGPLPLISVSPLAFF